ncbi:MAG: stage III sporulation protein AE [Clostridia bacterium]|nr:stage III sporulation protein AE [Clostridia bacterium]
MIICCFSQPVQKVCHAEATVEEQLDQEVNLILDDIDMSELENYFENNKEYFASTFNVFSFKDFVLALIRGEILTDYNSIFSAILGTIRRNFTQIMSPLLTILIIIMLAVLFKIVKPKLEESSVSRAIFFICYSSVIIVLASLMHGVSNNVYSVISNMHSQSASVLPIILFAMNLAGGSVSVKAYQPMVILLSNLVSTIFLKILFPLAVAIFVLSIISHLSTKMKLNNLIDFFKSLFKWIIGIVFTIYIGFMTIQGITASSADGISIKTAKYAIKNYVPMLGGYISDGFELVRAGAVIIKNAVGFAGIAMLVGSIISPILLIATLQLALKFLSGIVEPLSDSKVTSIISSASSSLSMMLTVLIGVFLMFFVSNMLLMVSLSGVI